MCVMLLRQPVTGRICIILITIVFFSCISRALGPDVTDYQGLSKQKFRIQQLNMIWDEALKHLKGQRLKNFLTELKAHEKATLNFKKKRDISDDEDGGSLKSVHSKKLKWIDESLNLEQDLENILSRHHLNPSLANTFKSSIEHSKVHDFEMSENHINSVLDTVDATIRVKFDEPRVEILYLRASAFASDVVNKYEDESKESRKRRKEFDEWFMTLDQDLLMLNTRLKKQRWLEEESNRLQFRSKGKLDILPTHDNGDITSNHYDDYADVQKRLKSIMYKIKKSEKEISERISNRKNYEFPTSRSEGEL